MTTLTKLLNAWNWGRIVFIFLFIIIMIVTIVKAFAWGGPLDIEPRDVVHEAHMEQEQRRESNREAFERMENGQEMRESTWYRERSDVEKAHEYIRDELS